MHSAAYNILNFGTLCLLHDLISDRDEIGLHTELMDAEGFLEADGAVTLRSEIALVETVLGVKLMDSASHGDINQHSNLNFWHKRKPSEFGQLYVAYDPKLWEGCRYISDSEWTRWKAYNNGVLLDGDRRTPELHAQNDGPDVIYSLTHPDCWYENYIHEYRGDAYAASHSNL